MKTKRKFIIKVTPIDNTIVKKYIKYIIKNFLGYSLQTTLKKEKAHIWSYKKSCEKIIKKIKTEADPTKIHMSYNYEIIEITDQKIIRKIKLKKLKK